MTVFIEKLVAHNTGFIDAIGLFYSLLSIHFDAACLSHLACLCNASEQFHAIK